MNNARSIPKLARAPRWRGRSVGEHAAALVSVCRAATSILSDQPDREKRLSRADPVPASTRAILRRLARRRDA